MSALEVFFLDRGLSYTLSKLLPYVLLPLVGLIIWVIISRWLVSRPLRLALLVLAITLPFGIYFALHPIYQGDFSNNGRPALASKELSDIKGDKLVVITIPGCQFCKESIGRMKEFKARNPNVDIEYRVCVGDSSATEAIKVYSDIAEGQFPVIQAKDSRNLADVAQGFFPTFVLVKKSGNVAWQNDDFGAGALDEVVARFQ